MRVLLVAASGLLAAAGLGRAAPELADPGAGLLELVTPPETAAQLELVDGLAFDPFGNLVAALEIPGPRGGLVHVDVETGEVTGLVEGIPRADQVALLGRRFRETAEFLVTSELGRAAHLRRLFIVSVFYQDDGRPIRLFSNTDAVLTPLAIASPEGLAVIERDGPYGPPDTVYVAEDVFGGRILRLELHRTMSVLASGLLRPEGLAFGDFGGAAEPALYAAETALHRIIRIAADGTVTPLGSPAAVDLGVIPVAIFGAEDLDAREIDPASLAFGPRGAPSAHAPEPLVDLDGDGREDLLVHFRVAATGISSGEAEACVRGSLFDGRPLRGCDAIETVPPVRPGPPGAVRAPHVHGS